MRIARHSILLAFVILFLSAAPNVQANLVYNGDMEIGGGSSTILPAGWSANSAANAGSSTDVPPGAGSQSVSFAHKDPPQGEPRLTQTISGLTPNTDYIFDFWFKGTLVGVYMVAGGNIFATGQCFWEWNFDPALPNPEYNWVHATHVDYGPEPWVITTPLALPRLTWYSAMCLVVGHRYYLTTFRLCLLTFPAMPTATASWEPTIWLQSSLTGARPTRQWVISPVTASSDQTIT